MADETRTLAESFVGDAPCPDCHGCGDVAGICCAYCDGVGRVRRSEVDADDWHYCQHGCGRVHFDHNETQHCACGHYCFGIPRARKPIEARKLIEQSALAAAALEAARPPPRRCRCGGARERTTGTRWNLICTVCGAYGRERKKTRE